MRYFYYNAFGYRTPDAFVSNFRSSLTDDTRRLFPRMFLGRDAGQIRGAFSVILARDDFPSPNEEAFLKRTRLKQIGEAQYEDVQSWAVDPDRVLDFARIARFLQQAPLAADDPFAPSEAVIPDQVSSIKHDNLFVWLCANGQGTYDTFRRTAAALDLPIEDGAARALLRRLRLLGHVEVSDDGERWFVTPPTVVELDDGSGHFLAGARDVKAIEALEVQAPGCVLLERHEAREAPKAVRIRRVPADEIAAVLARSSDQVACAGRAARRLAEALPPIDRAHQLFSRVHQANTHNYDLAIYNPKKRDYDAVSRPSRTGLYRLRASNGPDRTLLYLADQDAWYRGDWYGLRFVARHGAGDRCILVYDEDSAQVAVPTDWHLPELHERALVLASGFLPRKVDGALIYGGVTRETLAILADRLGATVEVKARA